MDDLGQGNTLVLDGVWFSYRSWFRRSARPALADVTFHVPQGCCFGLVGPNGAGKTTLVRLILGLLPCQQGVIRLFGSDPERFQHGSRVGYVPERISLYPFLTGRELLDFHARLLGFATGPRKEAVERLLDQFQLGEWADARISTYSKGLHQRLAIAQALLGEPELLVLDEPTEGLDPVVRRELLDLLVQLCHAGKTIFLNSHQLHEVERVCTHVAILNKGRVSYWGAKENLAAESGGSLEDFFLQKL